MSRKIVVENCKDCPNSRPFGGRIFCRKAKRDTEEMGIPDWCPLMVDIPFNKVQELIDAAEPFGENPATDRSNYMCHSGITSADKCARCSRGSRVFNAVKELTK